VPPTAGSSTASAARFYYDFASPEAYLAAERALHALEEVPEWVPVRMPEVGAFRCEQEVLSYREDVERRARALGVMEIRWPDPFPADTEWAMLAATYAKQIGRGVAFSLAAFRQAFAAGRDLSEQSSVLIAAAACEMHPAAVIKGASLASTARALEANHARAQADGITAVPAIWTPDGVLDGERAVPVAG
jgi:2-hydroxychromene-2-carboxylate isomerase